MQAALQQLSSSNRHLLLGVWYPGLDPQPIRSQETLCPVRGAKAEVAKLGLLGAGCPRSVSLTFTRCPKIKVLIARTPPEPMGKYPQTTS